MAVMNVTFPGGKRVDVTNGEFTIHTDQAAGQGGEGSAPDPFTLFLGSLATCAGYYVLAFCDARGISREGVRVRLRSEADGRGHLEQVHFEIELPHDFPEKYVDGVLRAADSCKVRRALRQPPTVDASVVRGTSG
jgi:ribosomal protein S12 methylthiotransferase accessory factor